MDYCGIYKFTNKEDGRVYIGKSKHIYSRYGSHYSTAFGATSYDLLNDFEKALHDAPMAFEFEIIEECSEFELDTKEREWILFYASTHELYNTIKAPRVYQFTLNGELLGAYSGYSEAARAIGKPNGKTAIYNCCSGRAKTSYGYRWSTSPSLNEIPEIEKEVANERRSNAKRAVSQFTLDGSLVATYESIRAAARAIGVTDGAIRHACSGRAKTCQGYVWKFTEENWDV